MFEKENKKVPAWLEQTLPPSRDMNPFGLTARPLRFIE